MTKSEMHLHDTAFIGPALLFLDQYFNSFIDEYIVLWGCGDSVWGGGIDNVANDADAEGVCI